MAMQKVSSFVFFLRGVEITSSEMDPGSNIWPLQVLRDRAKRRGRQFATGFLRIGNPEYEGDRFYTLTWSDICNRVEKYALYLQSIGLKAGDRIAIHSKNRVEWVLLDWAAISAGFVTVPVYAQSHIDELKYILKESETKILFVENQIQDLSCRQISFAELEVQAQPMTGTFYLPEGRSPNEIISISYTSGTSGVPKGVMHSLRNFYEGITRANEVVKIRQSDVLLSYLPLSHVVERSLVEFGSLYIGASVYYLDRVEKLSQFLPKVRPTIFAAVPRIWDMIRGRIERELDQPDLQQRLQKIPFFLRGFLVRRFLRQRLGFSRARLLLSGAAKLRVETIAKMKELGMPIIQGYGLTETLPVTAVVPTKSAKEKSDGSVGKAFRGVEIRIEKDGEVCLRAPFMFKGYSQHPELTAEVLSQDGWFSTGDIGHLDEYGNLYITDRKKNLFKATNGKYIAPLPIENLLRENPAIREVIVIGEDRPHCIAVASIDEKFFSESAFLDFLDRVNSKLASHEQVKSVGCMKNSWSTESGELTPTQKVKRKVVMQKYASEIDQLYSSRSRVRVFDQQDMKEREVRRAHPGF